MDSGNISAEIIAGVLEASGIRHVVCSPGSRNAPLVIALLRRSSISKKVIIDERTAAFVALGMAKTMQKPVALVCTSGTALLNYAPAVAEAYYSRVPLVVISADRPIQWIDQDDSQTLRQFEAFSNFILKSYDIPEIPDDDRVMTAYANRVVNDAVMTCTGHRCGPVHINVQFDSPLHSRRPLAPYAEQRLITRVQDDGRLAPSVIEGLCREAQNAKILFIAGFMAPDDEMNQAATVLQKCPNVYMMCETISNIHVAKSYCIDSLLSVMTREEKEALRPDIVISAGGALVSRYVKEYLRDYPPREHWTLGYTDTTVDCFLALTRRIEAQQAPVLRKLAYHLNARRVQKEMPRDVMDYNERWTQLKTRMLSSQLEFLHRLPWSDMVALNLLLRNIPSDFNLHLSNGTAIRYAQLLMRKIPHACYCNRGVSGIDGCTSTAIGSAMAYSRPTLLITGDMSFAYDMGALAVRDIPKSFKIAVINNYGGGIFRFIESTRRLPGREDYFCATPKVNITDLCESFGLKCQKIYSTNGLKEVLYRFFHSTKGPQVLEIMTPPDKSANILREYMARGKGSEKD